MEVHNSQAGLKGFGSSEVPVPTRGAKHAKHRGRKHGKAVGSNKAKLRRKRA